MAQNNDAYPYVNQVQHFPTQQALRFAWDQINALKKNIAGPTQGTLNPDQKPANLGPKDKGTLFYSTDFNRNYVWTGTAWSDVPGAPTRYQTATFLTSPEPVVGWAPCNGQRVTASTSIGGTQLYQTPVLNQPPSSSVTTSYTGLTTWVRL